MPAASPLPVAPEDLEELRRWARSSQLPAVLAQRARILLLAAEGVANTEIAERVGVSRPTVIACRRRYVRRGLGGLPNRPRPGRPQTVRRWRRAEILSVTLNRPPPRLGITHWSTRLLARELGVSRDTVARIWREYGVQPWRAGDLQVLHRPAAGRQGPRRRRAVPAPTRTRGRALRGREVPDPGPGTHPTRPPGLAGAPRAAHPRLHPPRHDHPVRRAGGRHRAGHRPVPPPPPPPGVPGLPQAGRPRLAAPTVARGLR
jgi:transposase